MTSIITKDGTEIFYKDMGRGQPIVFHHGWPLSSDDWDAQILFFLGKGYRVVAHDRRGHGRSSQTSDGHDMDHYAADVAAVVDHLDLRNAVHVGHSTGGGEATRWLVAFPTQRLEADAEAGGGSAALLGPSGAGELEAVINGERNEATAMGVGPRLRQQEQRQRIPAAGEGHGQRAPGARVQPPV